MVREGQILNRLTLYGRMPVLEALLDERAKITRLVVARNARGEAIDNILAAAAARRVTVERVDAAKVTRFSHNGRHDQGVVVDVESPGVEELDDFLTRAAGDVRLLLLDGLTNPANVGMIIRTAVAAGLDGVVLPRAGCPDLGPLVVKASAGVALFAPVLRAATGAQAARMLRECGVTLVGLAADAPDDLWSVRLGDRTALVIGNETAGVSDAVTREIERWCAIPLAGGVESLNAAVAAGVACFELSRRASQR